MTVPFSLQNLDHLVLRCRNVPAMMKFYCDVLGCTVERRQEKLGLTQLRAGHSLIDLVSLDGPLGKMGGAGPAKDGRNLDHFCLRIEPFDAPALAAYLRASGIEVGEPGQRYGADGLGLSIYIADPEGNVVELKGPPLP